MLASKTYYHPVASLILALVMAACTSQPQRAEKQSFPMESPGTAKKLLLGANARMLAGSCFGCHGPEGQSRAPAIPSLAGLPEDYFLRVMQAYQYGGRYSSVMGRIALGFNEQEIRDMARYFSKQEFKPIHQRVSWRHVNLGRHLHRRYCRECHGDTELAPSEGVISLNGHWMTYLRWTLRDYLVGINQSEAGMSQKLTELVRRHGAEGVEALVHYYASETP